MYGNRVVVTGLGALSPIGNSVDDYWNSLMAGTSGAGRITAFDATDLPVQMAAEVKGFDPGDYMDRKAARRMERFAQFSIAASGQALADARLQVTPDNEYDVGAIIATGGGGIGAVAVRDRDAGHQGLGARRPDDGAAHDRQYGLVPGVDALRHQRARS